MDQITCLSDSRLLNNCIYCGRIADTREHVPSKVFLDHPYPGNLPIVRACLSCNNDFSKDEEYVASLIEITSTGTTDPSKIKREKISNLLERSIHLKYRIQNSMSYYNERIIYCMEAERINKIFIKLAKGHAAFELSQVLNSKPKYMWWGDISTLSEDEKKDFLSDIIVGMFGEVGSRNSRRLIIIDATLKELSSDDMKTISLMINPWIEVQENQYSYIADDSNNSIQIRMLVGGFFACKIIWSI